MREYYLWLNSLRELGINKKIELIRRFGDPKEVYINLNKEMTRQLEEEGFLKESAVHEIDSSKRADWFANYINVLEAEEIRYITPIDEEYPDRLLSIYDAPLALFYKGDISLLKDTYGLRKDYNGWTGKEDCRKRYNDHKRNGSRYRQRCT